MRPAERDRPVLVLHDAGDAAGGRPWREALADAAWPGPVLAPDLPGHADAPAPTGGAYEPADAAVHVLADTAAFDGMRPIVVGVGVHGWAAQVLALGGRSSGLVLVDGLGGPWLDAFEATERGREWLRAIADDPEAVSPPPRTGLDPRLRHGLPCQSNRALARRAASAIPVPALIVESPSSQVSAPDRHDLVGRFRDATLVELRIADALTVAVTMCSWVSHRF